MPASSVTRMATMNVSVRRAFLARGSRNALTPLLTASIPVIAVHPFANERTTSQRPAAATELGNRGGGTTLA